MRQVRTYIINYRLYPSVTGCNLIHRVKWEINKSHDFPLEKVQFILAFLIQVFNLSGTNFNNTLTYGVLLLSGIDII